MSFIHTATSSPTPPATTSATRPATASATMTATTFTPPNPAPIKLARLVPKPPGERRGGGGEGIQAVQLSNTLVKILKSHSTVILHGKFGSKLTLEKFYAAAIAWCECKHANGCKCCEEGWRRESPPQ